MASKDAPVFHELPQSMKVLVVDDEADILERNMTALREALSPPCWGFECYLCR